MTANTESKIRWTSADLELIPENGNRYEIIDGQLYMTRAPHCFHQNAGFNIGVALELWRAQQDQRGVREYWIVDWQKQEVEVYRRSQNQLALVHTLLAEDQLTSPLFPSFALNVADIFL